MVLPPLDIKRSPWRGTQYHCNLLHPLPDLVTARPGIQGDCTANAERAKTVACSPVFFLAGTKLTAPAGSPIAFYRGLAGKTADGVPQPGRGL